MSQILINLLPHRERARQQRLEQFKLLVAAAALAGILATVFLDFWLELKVTGQKAKNQLLQTEIQQLEQQIQSIAGQELAIAALKSRQSAVEDLQADRNLPVQFMTDLARLLPEGMYLTSLKQTEQLVTIQGSAQSNEKVSEFLRHLANSSAYFTKPELVEILITTATLGPREQHRVANFAIRVQLQRTLMSGPPAAPAQAATPADSSRLSLSNLLPSIKP
jgi:type IV pilus assembly protein PilN